MLRNIKLAPPRTLGSATGGGSPRSASEDVHHSASEAITTVRSSQSDEEQEEAAASMPAQFGRLGVRETSEAEGALGDAETGLDNSRKKPPPPPPPPQYTWFSLYDDQGVGGRRNSKILETNDGVGSGDSIDGSNASSGRKLSARPPKHARQEAAKSEKGTSGGSSGWKWGWGRKGSGNALASETAAAGGPEATTPPKARDIGGSESSIDAGKDGVSLEDTTDLQMSALEILPAGDGGEGEAEKREKQRRKRKDVYSYFAMPLVRALEAQTGTTAWLRKVCVCLYLCVF